MRRNHISERKLALQWAAVGALSLCFTLPSKAGCKLLQVAELPVTMAGTAALIPVVIDSHPTQMMVDTGAALSLIWRSAATDLKLKISSDGSQLYGAGGSETRGTVIVKNFTVAGATIPNVALYTAGRGSLPGNSAGVIGEDLLKHWDVEFDLPESKIRLFSPKGCSGGEVVYWASKYSMSKLERPPANSDWVETEVGLDGHKLIAQWDSGAGASFITSPAVERARLNSELPVKNGAETQGLAGKAVDTRVAVFQTLSIGQEQIRNATLRVADLFGKDSEQQTGSSIAKSAFEPPEVIIGADFFGSHRILIATSQSKLYFTYTGGPVFQRIQQASQPAAPAPAAGNPAADGTDKTNIH